MDAGDKLGKFFIGENAYILVENITKKEMICSFVSLLNYRVIGDTNEPDALDPSGGPFVPLGYRINDFMLVRIWWNPEEKKYLMLFKRE